MGIRIVWLLGWMMLVSSTSGLSQPSQRLGFIMPERARSHRIPVDIQHNVILIPVRINGSFEMNFILDTGVKTTILTEAILAPFLHLDTTMKVKVRGLGEGEPIDALLADNVNIDLPGMKGYGMRLLVLPENLISYSGMFGRPVYGIIGYDLFSQFVVEINYLHKYIQLYDAFTYKVKRKHKEIPLMMRHGKPYVEATMTDYRGVKFEGKWLLDTGSSNAIALFEEDLPLPPESIPAFLGKGLSGNVYGRMAKAPSFQIGEFVFEEVIAGYPDSSSLNLQVSDSVWYGNIGAEILSRFHVTFDYFRNRVYLRKVPGFKEPFEYNVSGIEIVSRGDAFDQFVISYVRPSSPAADAGVLEGDEILSLNGFAVNGMDIDTVYGTLIKRNGKMMVMRIRRGDLVIRKKFELVPEI